jgi:hypothetical protein
MLDSDFWRDLANGFRAIDPSGFLRADWHCSIEVGHQGPPPPTIWRLPGGKLTRSIQVEFEALARRAGPKVHPYVDSLNGWLEALRESGFNAEQQPGFGIESNEQGAVVAHAYSGTISSVCLASADLCKHYESAALEQERMADVHRESQSWSKDSHPTENEPEENPPDSITTRLSREERLQAFTAPASRRPKRPQQGERRAALLAEYKKATGDPSSKRIYESQNAPINKPEFYPWLRGELPETSKTTIKFEKFLREKKRPIPKNPRTL